MAACSGGIITSGLLGHLAEEGRLGDVASLTLLVCALDNAQAGTTEALATRPVAAAAVAESARRGYLDGDALASVFSWLRPNDLIWNYVVNNYLLGKEPPAFDILYWNQDTVRMAAGLHRDFVMMALESALATPGGMRVLGSDVDLGQGRPRHVHRRRVQRPHRRLAQRLPLHAAARRRQPLRALDERSHPGADQPAESGQPVQLPDRRRQPAGRSPTGRPRRRPSAAAGGRTTSPGSSARSGERVPAPKRLGSRAHKAIAKAPGTYVLAA